MKRYAESFNEVWLETLRFVVNMGDKVEVRGRETREILGDMVAFPMATSILTTEARKLSYDFMFAEALWIISGSNRVEPLLEFAPSYKKFSDDGMRLSGAYGPKIIDQISYVVECLRLDPQSRQAVINVWRERPGMSKDIPCTLSIQFTVRDGKIHAFVNMRSNDVWLGMPYDVFTVTMLTLQVGIELSKIAGKTYGLGMMHHCAASRHVYESDLEKARSVITNEGFRKSSLPHRIELRKLSGFVSGSLEFQQLLEDRVHVDRNHKLTTLIRKEFPWLTYGLPNVG